MSKILGEDSVNKEIPNLLQTGPLENIQVTVEQEKGVSGVSSVSRSEKAGETTTLNPNAPHLSIPHNVAIYLNQLMNVRGLTWLSQEGKWIKLDPAALTFSMMQKYHEIIISMLDKWSESIKEQGDRMREELNSLSYLQWLEMNKGAAAWPMSYYHWMETLAPADRAQAAHRMNTYQIFTGTAHSLSNYRDYLIKHGPTLEAPLIIGSLAAGSGILPEYLKQIGGGIHKGVEPILSAITQMGKPLLDANMTTLAYFGTLFGRGVSDQSALQVALNVGHIADSDVNIAFAKAYGHNMGELVETPSFNLFLNSAVANALRGGKTPTEAESAELVHAMKFVLLITSLAIVYKSETKEITDQEIGAMLKLSGEGRIPVEDDPVKLGLRNQILAEINGMGKMKASMVNAALTYLNTNPSFEELFDSYRVFEGIRKTEELSNEVQIKGGPG